MPLSYVIGSPLAGLLLGLSWLALRGWRWLFILEGIPAVLLGLITLVYLTDWPRQATWLPSDEREWIIAKLEKEKKVKQDVRSYSIWQALRHRDVILLTFSYFFCHIRKLRNRILASHHAEALIRTKRHASDASCLLALYGGLPDAATERMAFRPHSGTPLACRHTCIAQRSRAFFAIGSGTQVALSIIFFTLVGGAYYTLHPAFWSVPTEFLSASAAAASIGLINSVGNLGGFFGPLTRKIHDFRNTEGLAMVQIRCLGRFETKNEAFA
jgi:ACS family tartrate transporter-like MFS transporter